MMTKGIEMSALVTPRASQDLTSIGSTEHSVSDLLLLPLTITAWGGDMAQSVKGLATHA